MSRAVTELSNNRIPKEEVLKPIDFKLIEFRYEADCYG